MSTPEEKVKTVETVAFPDGRVVEFVGKRKMLKESFPDAKQIRLDFRNGETRTFTIPEELYARFACHGAEQKLGDETAGVEDVEDMVLAVDDLIGRLEKGEWSVKREGGGFGGTSVLLRALVEFSGRTTEKVKAFLAGMSQAEKMALRNSAKLKPIVERLEAEKVAKVSKVDTDALLDKLPE
jgi:hypothetical protein